MTAPREPGDVKAQVDPDLRRRYGLPTDEEAAQARRRRPAWALLGPRFLSDGELSYAAALGLGFLCALLGGILITAVIVLVHKLLGRQSDE